MHLHYKGIFMELKTDGRGDTTNNDEVAIVKSHICSKCKSAFTTQKSLKVHFKNSHMETKREKTIPCHDPGCNLKFETKSLRNNHWKVTHASATLKCQSFRTPSQLKWHIIHSHKKVPYICPLCGMSMSFNINNNPAISEHKRLSHGIKTTLKAKKAITAMTATIRARAATRIKLVALRRLNREDIFEDNLEEYEAVSNVVKRNEITVIAINCNGLLGDNAKQFKKLVNLIGQPTMVCAMETWTCDIFSLEGYHQPVVSFRQNGMQGGGIMVWLRDSAMIQHSEVVVMPDSGEARARTLPTKRYPSVEALHVKVKMINSLREFEVTTVYRHPGVRIQPTFAALDQIIDSYLEDPTIVSIVVGDVNIDTDSHTKLTVKNKYLDTLTKRCLYQHIVTPT
jgi:hypothetical protein